LQKKKKLQVDPELEKLAKEGFAKVDFKEVRKWFGRGANLLDVPKAYSFIRKRKDFLKLSQISTWSNSVVPPLEKLVVQEIKDTVTTK